MCSKEMNVVNGFWRCVDGIIYQLTPVHTILDRGDLPDYVMADTPSGLSCHRYQVGCVKRQARDQNLGFVCCECINEPAVLKFTFAMVGKQSSIQLVWINSCPA